MLLNKKIIILLILVGIGIGLIISSLLNIINPRVEIKEYTDEEIKVMAKELGMVDIKEIIENNLTDEEVDEDDVIGNKDAFIFEIKKGEVSEIITRNLFEAGIIEDKEEFEKLINEKDASKSFRFGIYEIPKKASYEEIIEILSK